MALWRVNTGGRSRLATGSVDEGPQVLLSSETTLGHLLGGDVDFMDYETMGEEELLADWTLLAPCDEQETWASGITFVESRYAREAESTQADFYRDVYNAERPELFLKATAGSVIASGEDVGIRSDSGWNVPEPELGLVIDVDRRIVAYTIGNDVSSRSIEGENPLYLPQAKVYDRSCSLGPCLVPLTQAQPQDELTVTMSIERQGNIVFKGTTSLSRLKRSPRELTDWLFKALSFPRGVILLTGTGIIPPDQFSLRAGDITRVDIPGIGSLVNGTVVVGDTARGPL